MAHEQLNLTNDELLSTTRAVRKRLDFDRDVPMSVIKECMEIACLLYTSPSPRDVEESRMPSSA